MAAPGSVVRIVNEGDTDFKDAYNSQPYTIPAHGQMFVEYDAMCLWLGHPEANNFNPRNRVRLAEYQRLRSRYGVDARALEQTLTGINVDADELFQKMRPRLVVYEAGTDTRIITVADDPSGDTVFAVPEEQGDNQAIIHARMAQMEQEMANLRAQLAQQQRTEQALNDAQPIANDNPDLSDGRIEVGASGIPGTIETPITPPTSDTAPRPAPRTTPTEDSPTRVRVSG